MGIFAFIFCICYTHYMRTQISQTNRYTLIGFTLFNLACIWYFAFFDAQKSLLAGIFLINLVILRYNIFLNTKYWKEHKKLLGDFSEFIKNRWARLSFPEDEEFVENAQFLSLFKRTYIEQNLLKKDYRELQWVFEKFIPKNIHDEIGFRGYERIVLGTAIAKTLTVMFLDIVGFTAVSEEIHNPYRTLLLLNIYFDGIGEIVYRYGGYIDKYLWDGILIVFDKETSDDAIHAAIEIQEFIKKFQIGAIWRRMRVGIGINTGDVTMGTIGTKRRMDATVIGDAVNIASRLERLTRTYDAGIIMSDSTYKSIEEKEKFSVHFLADERIKWRNAIVKIYSVDEFENVSFPKESNF